MKRYFFPMLLLCLVLISNIMIVFMGNRSLAISKIHAAELAAIRTKNLAQAVDQSISSLFKRFDHCLVTIKNELEKDLASGSLDFPRLGRLIAIQETLIPEMIAMRVTDATGKVIIGKENGVDISFAARPFFPFLRDNPTAGMYVSRPDKSYFTSRWMIPSARRYNYPDGSFAGVVTVPVLVEHFQKLLSVYDLGTDGSIALRYQDNGLIARYSPSLSGNPIEVGDANVTAEYQEIAESAVTLKTFCSRFPFDKIYRTITFRRLETIPMVVLATLSEDDYLKQWKNDRSATINVISAFILITWLMFFLFWNMWKRRLHDEEILQQSEEKHRLLFDSAGDAIFIHDEKSQILAANNMACERLGYTLAEFVSMTASQLEPPEELEKASLRATRLLENGILTYETLHCSKVGEKIHAEVTVRKMLWGGHPATVSVCRDITERKKAEALLAAEKERLAVTLRSIGDGVITTDTEGKVVIMNKVAEKLTGWPLSEARGQPLSTVFNIISEVTRMPCENPVEKVLATGGIIELENHTLLIAKDGTERVIADSGAPIMDKNSLTIGVVLVFRDMTEKQKLLDALQRTDKLDSLGVLAVGIAHDFNNMLAGIFGFIELARASTDSKKISDYLEKSLSVYNRARNLTQQLLTFSKGGIPHRETSDLGHLIKESSSFALSGSKVACDYDIDKDLWLADFDKNQIGQVIDNLVINAQQAMPDGGKIFISARNTIIRVGENPLLKPGKYIKMSITDTGTGIKPDLLKRIFDPFFTTKPTGHGLGLATCYAIMQKHEGCIDVESIIGKGTTFHIFLPAAQQGVLHDICQSSVLHKGSGRILIMDDEACIREIVTSFLESMGYKTFEAKNGEEALLICADASKNSQQLAGAILDLTIPGGMGGKETISLIRKDFPHLRVYASSGYSEDPVMARPTEYGFTDSIRKPFRKDELATLLNKHNS